MVHLAENLTQKFVRRGSWIYLFAFLSGPLGYAIKIMISHDVSVSDVGILYTTLSLILLIGSLNDFGMVESLHFFGPKLLAEGKRKKVKAMFIYAFIAMVTTSVLTCTSLYFGSEFLAREYFNADGEMRATVITILQAFSLYLIINNLQHYFSTVAYVHQNTILAKGIDAFRLLISALCGYFIFFGNSYGAREYVALWNYGAIPATIIGGVLAWKYHLKDLLTQEAFEFSKSDFLELIKYSGWALLANNAILLLSQIDIQLVMKLSGPEQAGIYSNYVSLISIPFLLIAPIIGFLFPVISAYNGAQKHETIKTIVQTFTRLFLLVGIATTGVLFALGKELGTFFFTNKFEESGHILYWSLGFLVFNFLLQINFNLLAAIGKVKKRLQIVVYGIGVNFILNLILIHYYDAAGSAMAVGISWVFLWYLSYKATQEYHKKIEWRIQTINAGSFLLLGAVGYYLIKYLGLSGEDKLEFLGTILGFSLFCGFVFLIIHKKDIQDVVNTLKKKKNSIQPSTQID